MIWHLNTNIRLIGAIILLAGWPGMGVALGQDEFPLKDGDTWVMLGDSITEQHLHSNYIEAFCFARFPNLNFRFRNAGVSGDTIYRILLPGGRFDWDVARWKPTLVSVALGANDAGSEHPDPHQGPTCLPAGAFIANMAKLAENIRKIGARPVFFSPSAVNDFTISANRSDQNQRLEGYATALRAFAAEQKAPFADQYHPLVDVWAGKRLAGESVHIAPGGQLTMAAALLQGLNAPGLVSKATLDGTGKVGPLTQCLVSNVFVEKSGGLSFDRLDECLPMPIPVEARGGIIVYPSIAELSQWILTVTGLKSGPYQVSIDGVPVARVSADELAHGWNMGLLEEGPVADQCRRILQLVTIKESWVSQSRDLAHALAKKCYGSQRILDELNQRVLEADAKIREAAQPKSRHFSITPLE